jgi:formamidopyrimidine-DNA glycosylase
MPELPEVENVRRSLIKLVKGKTIGDIQVKWPKIIQFPHEADQFRDALCGQTFRGLDRKGKFLVFLLDDYALVSHLRMEGHYSLHERRDPPDKHTHVVFRLTDGTELRYRDVRKFGTMHLFQKGTEDQQLPLSKLGPEPFSPAFSAEYLLERFQKTDRIIKAVLLDQSVVAGLGNIYADEVLFRSSIHPLRPAKSISGKEAALLKDQIIQTLHEAIEAGGSSVNTYMNALGLAGSFQEQLSVYGKKGESCVRCGTAIEKIKAAGRGTHFCPSCQTMEE